MDARNSVLLKILPYAGAVPFLSGAGVVMLGVTSLPVFGSVQTLVLSYGLAILSFMAGVHWGQYLSGVSNHPGLLVSSNTVTVLAWIGYIILPAAQFSILLIALFTALLLIDRQLAARAVLQRDYMRTRTAVTLLVIVSLAVFALMST